ncbi:MULTISPECIES: DUF3375 domain-containing protein [unclassified Microcoleus]|uniref:DUF3375 domain-containing protein n=1 Tax=unclassified Microcoleus TaxID=2642155 RepID=UPI002FCF0941
MKHDQIEDDLKNEPSLKLLRTDNAPLIISFLYREFKSSNRITVSQSELVEKLENYLDKLCEDQPELYRGKAQTYLDTWCNSDHQFLKRYYQTKDDDPVFELTPGTNRAIGWLEDLKRREFIGTESQFLEIFSLLKEIVTKSTEDPAARLDELEKQRAAIQKEIDTIKQTGEVERYSEAKLKEWFLKANNVAGRLLADFGEVEQNFKAITDKVKKAQLKEEGGKGLVVALVIDADEEIRKSDQGRSFYAFRDFLTDPSKQEELEQLINGVYGLPELQDLGQKHPILRRIKRSLIQASDKIIKSNYRLAEQLRKMLEEEHIAENKRVIELIKQIKKSALAAIDNPPKTEEFIWIEGDPEVQLVMERPLGKPTEERSFKSYNLSDATVDLPREQIDALRNYCYVDEEVLKRQIAATLEGKDWVTLAEVIEKYPVEKGLSEVVAYLAIASQDTKHAIDDSVSDRITVSSFDKQNILHLTLPQVIFKR